jgi:hypothetical protein
MDESPISAGIIVPVIVNGWQEKILYWLSPKSILPRNHPAGLRKYVSLDEGI